MWTIFLPAAQWAAGRPPDARSSAKPGRLGQLGGLFPLPSVTDYTLVEGHADGMFTARVDLAASMLALLADDRHLRTTVSVITRPTTPPCSTEFAAKHSPRAERVGAVGFAAATAGSVFASGPQSLEFRAGELAPIFASSASS
ncbi:hypothetical protein [Streptomyces sp. NRRL S-337]|uniref:hypothetical protein n=1 Tax=Streptomyces sp. NRRL S-337 TaxID=1463900 RepID=UPI0004C95F1D|nr:hypothetical protein [Streptomyces sp. NRRL S-337]